MKKQIRATIMIHVYIIWGTHVCAGIMVYDKLRNCKRMNDTTICEFDVKMKWFLRKLKKVVLMTVAKITMICD